MGAHARDFCLGAPLARLEVRVALDQPLDRYGELVVDHEHTRHQNPWVTSSLLSLPVQGIPVGPDGARAEGTPAFPAPAASTRSFRRHASASDPPARVLPLDAVVHVSSRA